MDEGWLAGQSLRGPVVDLTVGWERGQELGIAAREVGYPQGQVLLVRASGPPTAVPQRRIHIYVQENGLGWAERMREDFPGKEAQERVTFVGRPEEADLIVGDWTLTPTPRLALLQVDQETVGYVTPALLAGLEERGLLQPGIVLVVGRLVKGALGEHLLVFA